MFVIMKVSCELKLFCLILNKIQITCYMLFYSKCSEFKECKEIFTKE